MTYEVELGCDCKVRRCNLVCAMLEFIQKRILEESGQKEGDC